jgi:hypothetical protein
LLSPRLKKTETDTFKQIAPRHTAYLEKMGYEKQADGTYARKLRR